MSIQDEISILRPNMMNKCFQLNLRKEEKLKRKSEQNNRGRGGRNLEAAVILEEGIQGKGPKGSLTMESRWETQVAKEAI